MAILDHTQVLAVDVHEWANEAFPGRTDASMGLKLYGEIGEMLESDGDPMEVADVFIMMLDYAVRKNVNIRDAVLKKLEINRNRNWEINPNTGVMRHVEP